MIVKNSQIKKATHNVGKNFNSLSPVQLLSNSRSRAFRVNVHGSGHYKENTILRRFLWNLPNKSISFMIIVLIMEARGQRFL